MIGTLSKGFRQRVGLADAIFHDPKVLVLDEPTVGLDPKQIVAIRELIRELGEKHTILLSTHILPEVELLCSRVIIIDRGRIVAEGTPQALRERFKGQLGIAVELATGVAGAAEALEALAGVASVAVDPMNPGRFLLECEPASDPRASIFHLAVERGWTLLGLAAEHASLEDVFVRLTTRDAGAAGQESEAAA